MTVVITKPTGTFIHIPKNAGVAISQDISNGFSSTVAHH